MDSSLLSQAVAALTTRRQAASEHSTQQHLGATSELFRDPFLSYLVQQHTNEVLQTQGCAEAAEIPHSQWFCDAAFALMHPSTAGYKTGLEMLQRTLLSIYSVPTWRNSSVMSQNTSQFLHFTAVLQRPIPLNEGASHQLCQLWTLQGATENTKPGVNHWHAELSARGWTGFAGALGQAGNLLWVCLLHRWS